MAALICDICGGKLSMVSGGVAICDNCGMEHSKERLKEKVLEISGTVKIDGPVQIDNSHLIENYLKLANVAYDSGNKVEAENYANKIIEINPENYEAWILKGKAAGWQSTISKNRFNEAIIAWANAITYASGEEKDEIVEDIADEIVDLANALISTRCTNFTNLPDESRFQGILDDLEMLKDQILFIKVKTGDHIILDNVFHYFADLMNSAACNASNKAKREFGPTKRDMSDYAWKEYHSSMDLCVKLLQRALLMAKTDSLKFTIYNNMIDIERTVKDSCSYYFDGYGYKVNLSFTYEAKGIRQEMINKWKKEKIDFDPEVIAKRKAEKEKLDRFEKYWNENLDLKRSLEKELQEIEEKLKTLGLFAIKEKSALNTRRKEIDNELIKDR